MVTDSQDTPPAFGDIRALGQETRPRGHPNFNHVDYVAISDAYLSDALAALAARPDVFARNVADGALTSVIQPPSAYWHLSANRDRIALLDISMTIIGWAFLLTVVIMLGRHWREGLRRIRQTLTRQSTDPPRTLTLGLLLLNCAYYLGVTSLLEIGENHRFRFEIQPMLLVLLAVALTWGLRVLARPDGQVAAADSRRTMALSRRPQGQDPTERAGARRRRRSRDIRTERIVDVDDEGHCT